MIVFSMRKRVVRVMSYLVFVALGACAGTPDYMELRPIPPGSEVAIVVTNNGADNMDSAATIIGKTSLAGTSIGAATGFVGGLQSSVACGPYILVCAPALALAGAGTGAVVGTVGGAVVGAVKAAPEKHGIDTELTDIIVEAGIEQLLLNEFRNGASGWRVASTEDATIKLETGLLSLSMPRDDNEEREYGVTNYVIVHYLDESPRRTKMLILEYTGIAAPDEETGAVPDEAVLAVVTAGIRDNVRQALSILH